MVARRKTEPQKLACRRELLVRFVQSDLSQLWKHKQYANANRVLLRMELQDRGQWLKARGGKRIHDELNVDGIPCDSGWRSKHALRRQEPLQS